MEELKQKFDVLIGGITIQSREKKKGIGTLACVVFDVDTGKPLGLSNNHILKFNGGDVYQPRNKNNQESYFVGKIYKKSRINDCAVFEIDINKRDYNRENSIYGLKGKIVETIEPYEGLRVQKIGQYTGHTYGIVSKEIGEKNFKILPNPDKPCKEISMGGDSGALWVTDENDFKAVGLHKGGESNKRGWFRKKNRPDRAYAIRINVVLKDLNIEF